MSVHFVSGSGPSHLYERACKSDRYSNSDFSTETIQPLEVTCTACLGQHGMLARIIIAQNRLLLDALAKLTARLVAGDGDDLPRPPA